MHLQGQKTVPAACMDKDTHVLVPLLKFRLFQLTVWLNLPIAKTIALQNVCTVYGPGVF